jgi:recombinational DNA repair ATPase RecF
VRVCGSFRRLSRRLLVGERVTCVQMRAFRGVREELALEFPQGTSVVLLGENATGKSTVADALEWYFTGEIGLLRHEGRAGSLRHVGARSSDATSVTVQTTGALGGRLEQGETPAGAVRAAGRETFLLRGRTLTAFVERTKGEKWRALAELLGFEEVDQLRLDLQTARNEAHDAVEAAGQEHHSASRALASKVGVVTDSGIFETMSELCRKAGVPAPASLVEALSAQWARSLEGASGNARAVRVAALASDLRTWSPASADGQVLDRWNWVLKSQNSTDRARFGFFKAAEPLLAKSDQAGSCPLCGQSVDREVLRRQVRDVLEELRASAEELQQTRDKVLRCADLMERCAAQMAEYRRKAAEIGVEIPAPPVAPHGRLRAAITRHEPAEQQLPASFTDALNAWLAVARAAIDAAVSPASTPRDGTLVALGVLIGQARRWRELAVAAGHARKAYKLAESVFQAYAARQQAYFADILDRISGRVAEIYAKLHPGEDLADVCIEPWGPKGVELAISFYGSHQKPPHGVLSESHLNSLAVALFLAMADSFNEQLDFLVLDDVVNSFDVEHRGELAAFIAGEFTHRQLIVLTHDQLFFDRLTRLAPSWKRIEFTSWDFYGGPRAMEYQSAKMLEKAQFALDNGDRAAAAMMGRRALEEALQDICEGLAAPLPFRRGARNDRREFGEVLSGVRRALKELSRGTYNEVRPLLDALDADVATALNPEAHASQVHPSSAEVRAAIQRVSQLDEKWTCAASACRTRLWHRGTPPVLQCKCGLTRFPPPPDTQAVTPSGSEVAP